jgi:hypothetical protein
MEITEIKGVVTDSHLTHSFSQRPMNISVDNADNFGRKVRFLSHLPSLSVFHLRFSKSRRALNLLIYCQLAQTSTFPVATAVASGFSTCFI